MRIFGLTITRTKAAPGSLSTPDSRGWWPLIREPFGGAWQRNLEANAEDVIAFSAVYSCVTLIAADISKLLLQLVAEDADGIWSVAKNPAYSPVIRKPNHWQNRIKFIEQWVLSKLLRGNTYVLKARDGRGVTVKMFVLDPQRVQVLVAPDGAVYYRLQTDHLSGVIDGGVVVPAREIIHDLMNPLYHPLVGVSPVYACSLAALQGLRIQATSSELFQNRAQPSGILSGPQIIDEEKAKQIQRLWQEGFTGSNSGKVAVLGSDLKYSALTISPEDAQLIEQLKWTSETVCSCFHVPPYMISVGAAPTLSNIEALNQQYYSQCLQVLIESLELCLDEGLELKDPYGVEFDLDGLIRMDGATKMKTSVEGVSGGIFKPNEARATFGLKPVAGGDTPYLQMQNFSLAALEKRDARADPFARDAAAPSARGDEDGDDEIDDEEIEREASIFLRKHTGPVIVPSFLARGLGAIGGEA